MSERASMRPPLSGDSSRRSSRVRPRAPASPREAAGQRVREHLRGMGLRDAGTLDAVVDRLLADLPAETTPEAAAAHAAARVTRWLEAVRAHAEELRPELVRAVLAAEPSLFLDERRARDLATRVVEAERSLADRRLAPQPLRSSGAPRWLLGLAPALTLALGSGLWLARGLAADGLSLLDVAWSLLLVPLVALNAISATLALLGLVRRLTATRAGSTRAATRAGAAVDAHATLPRTALVIPVFHEDAQDVFAAIAAMREALEEEPGGGCFEIFVLSDSRDGRKAADEERAWRRVASEGAGRVPLYYRRRAKNLRQKSGNLEEFLERWAHRYTYMVVLDADSLVGGATLMELVRRMEARPQLGLLQLPIAPIRAETPFARTLQFASSVHGPLFTSGLAAWAGRDGTYYGHNAIVRVDAFVASCVLPALEGEPPLGGHILSHDFVEAALLRRAGWEVSLADDLEESYEELPPTLSDYAKRDRRWCQGNLQHLRILGVDGLPPMSRLHLLLGAANYLASPLWLAFLLVGYAELGVGGAPADIGVGLTGLALGLVLGPRVLGLLATLASRARRRAHGGALRVIVGTLLEILTGSVIAPRLMLYHTRFVLEILLGRAVGWTAQRRRVGRSGLAEATREHGAVGAAGLVAGATLSALHPALALYGAPVWGALALAPLVALLGGSRGLGALLGRAGVFRVPSESAPSPIMQRADRMRGLTRADAASRFRDLVLDPVLNAALVAALEHAREGSAARASAALVDRALERGPTVLVEAEREALLGDPDAMRALHENAWQRWPVELWDLARELPSEPIDDRTLA